MTDRIDENPPMSIPEQAAEWLLRWHCGDLSIAERFEYLQWLKTSPVHIAETLRMCRLYSWLENTKLTLFITNEDSFSNVVELPPRDREGAAARGGRTDGLWRARFAAGLAALALIAVIGVALKMTWLDHTLQTQASEWRSVPLSDGSSVTAGPYTKLHHDIGDAQRLVTLAQGRAMFRVAKDPSRPFLVDAGVVVVRATGTQFTVERHDGQVKVTMREGSVVVTPAAGTDAPFTSQSLMTDEELTISDGEAPSVAHVDGEVSTEWARGRLIFNLGDTVKFAVDQFNSYNGVKIVVDEATGARPMRGVFDANDPLSFADSVKQITGATVVHETPETVRIGPREPRSR
jgi:transmembrane sensor